MSSTFSTIVIGGGAGGLSLAALLSRHHSVLLLEKSPVVGGCATTFWRSGLQFPTGATTIAGFDEHMPLPCLLRDVELAPLAFDFYHPGMWVSGEGGWSLGRWQEFDQFIHALQSVFPHPGNEPFWREVLRINRIFWQHWHSIRYNPHTLTGLFSTLIGISPLLRAFPLALISRADRVIDTVLPNISPGYRQFLDAQMLIAIQSTAKHVSFASAALALGYTFTGVATPAGGMRALPEALATRIAHVHCKEPVIRVQRRRDRWEVTTTKGEYCAPRVVLNVALEAAADLFAEGSREVNYFTRSNCRFDGVGAFVTYFVIRSVNPLPVHHQYIARHPYPHATSSALFFSTSQMEQTTEYLRFTVSASLHVDAEYWIGLSADSSRYREAKSELEAQIAEAFKRLFPHVTVETVFSATPKTYRHYTGRATVGGIPATLRHQWRYPSSYTPFPGLYRTGDTTFPGQGWPGVVMGAYQALRAVKDTT